MASTHYNLLEFLRWLDTEANLKCPLKSEVQTLLLKTSFLEVFLSCQGKWQIGDENLKVLLTRIQTVFQNADMELRRLWADRKRLCPDLDFKRFLTYLFMIESTEDLFPDMLERLQLLMPHIQQVYTILSKSPRSTGDVNYEAITESLHFLLENIEDLLLRFNVELVSLVKEELEAVAKCLRFLRDFLCFTSKRCSELGKLKDLLILAEVLVDNISCLLFLHSVNERMDDQMVKEMKMQLSSELQKISPAQPEAGKIYIEALKTSKSELGMFDLDYSFVNYVLELSYAKFSSMTSNGSQITFLYEEARFLAIFFFQVVDESWVHDKMFNFFWERIKAVITDTLCAIINSLHDDAQIRNEAGEFRMAVYDLQHFFMLKRENAIKADYIYLQRPWRFLGPNSWGDIGSQLEFLEKQLEVEDEFIGPLKHQIELVWEELLLLNEAFSEFTANQPNLHEEIEIQRRRLIRIIDRTNFVVTSFIYRVVTLWSCKLELYYVIQNIKVIKMELGDIINRFTDDAEIFEDEQLRNGSKKLRILSIVGMLEFEDQLRCLGTHIDLTSPLKDEVQILGLKASFLRVFLSCRGKWHIEDRNLKVILSRMQSVFQNSDLRKLWTGFIQIESTECWGMPMNMECMLSSMQERLQLLNPDIQEVYTILSKSSRFITGMTDEAVTESLNTLLESIENLLRYVELASPMKEELEAVEKCLRFLKDFLSFTAKRCSKVGKLKGLLIHAEILIENISCLLYLCSASGKLNDQMVKEMKMQLSSELQKFSPAQPDVREIYIKALKASKSTQGNSTLVDEIDWGFLDSLQDYILVLSGTKMWSTIPVKDQILLLWEDLPFLIIYFAMGFSLEEHTGNGHKIFSDLLDRTSAALNETRYVIGSLQDDKKNDIYRKFSDFLARKIYDFYFPRSFRSNFPRTNGQGFIGSFLGSLKELLNTKADLVAPLKWQLEKIQNELVSVREDFSKTVKQLNQCEELQSQWTCFIDTAYHIEYVIDSFVAGRSTLPCHELGLFNALEEIKIIKMELKAIKNKIIDDKSGHMPSCFPSQFSAKATLPKANAVLSSKQRLAEEKHTSEPVIFPEVAEEIREQLRYGLKKLNFVSIVGMPGIGKTTLANSVFQHSLVTRHFHVRARCSVSQVYDKRRLLREILQQVTAGSNQCSDDDLDEKLCQCLKGRRYLIFMDDIWDIRPWKEIKISFPDDENGSRIMFTSRFDNIASQAGSQSTNYHLSPLSKDKSWEMLEWKIFGDGSCPTDLVELGREIAANCNGLPLTVDLIAGILRGKETKEWNKVAESMMEYLFDDPQGRCQKVLELSYQNLPDELKPCFLYFVAFPEDTDMGTEELILLWIAEGFVQPQKDDLRCLEDAAMEILNDLISRSLVIVSKRRPLGEVKESRIHDLLHNFALAKAKEERFMLKIYDKANSSSLSSDCYQWREQYRLCIYPHRHQLLESNPSSTRARALICSESLYWGISLQFSYFKLLKVLYIPNVIFRHHPTTIITLIHLRLLAIRFGNQILSEIHKLWNLETFFMNNDFYGECLFLDEICNMMRIRHFFFRHHISLGCRKENILEKSFQFDYLRTLYHVKVSYADDIEKIFKLMPNLVTLNVKFYNPDGGCYPFPKLDFLKKLESLDVTHDSTKYPCKIISFPLHLKTLVLSNFCVPWREISEFGNLEYIEILKLKDGAFEGAIWDMFDGQFPKLKYLCLYNLDIQEWNATEDHLSCLEQLHLKFCRKLEKLPLCLAEVATLQKIKLDSCLSSAESSAKRIKEEQEAAGNHQLVVDSKGIIYNDEEEGSSLKLWRQMERMTIAQ